MAQIADESLKLMANTLHGKKQLAMAFEKGITVNSIARQVLDHFVVPK